MWRNSLFTLLALAAAASPGLAQRPAGEVNTPPARGERFQTGLRPGDRAPDFTLADVHGKDKVTLSSYRGKKPVVLIFGSAT